jgi:phospholipid/cholesterol/gamma-HCH transport system substrate-binding protein
MITQAPPRHPAPAPWQPPAHIPKRRRPPAILIGSLILALAASAAFFGVKAAYGGFAHTYPLSVDVPRAGQQLRVGSDVRMHGVRVGEVSGIALVDPRTVRLTLRMEQRYQVPASAEAVITLKTLLGAKFIDLRFGRYAAPFLSPATRVATSHVGPELEDALADGVRVLDAIKPSDLAIIVQTLAEGARGHGDDIARGIHANAQLSDLFARTLDPQLQSLHDLAVTFEALKESGVDLNKLADAINHGVPVYASPAAQQDLRAALDALTPFANDLADLLINQKADWDRLMVDGDTVLATIAARQAGLRDLIVGLYRYVFKLSGAPFQAEFLKGSGAAGFVDFLGCSDNAQNPGDDCADANHQAICAALPVEVKTSLAYCDGY